MTPFESFYNQAAPYLWLVMLVALLGGFVWLILLQRRLLKATRSLKQVDSVLRTGSGGESGLNELLDRLKRVEQTGQMLDMLQGTLRELELRLGHTYQSVGLVRFNPFSDMGGDQSFALAIVDSFGDGFVMSSLHGRANTRVYAKTVKRGQAGQTVSNEEQQAIEQAMRMQQLPPATSSSQR
jgi:hypothetical protein